MIKEKIHKTNPMVWHDCNKKSPAYGEYNKEGYVIVAYEDGTVTNGSFDAVRGEWRNEDSHGRALYWTPYPEHPVPELIRETY